MNRVRAFTQRWGWLLLALYLALFFVQKTNLVTSDLGRHLKNGQVILQTGQVFSTNLYSYTLPEFPVTNHHWLFGVLQYVLHQVGGFPLLTISNVFLMGVTFGILIFYSWKKYGALATTIATVGLLPLLTKRVEIRPETLSMLFAASFYVLLSQYSANKRSLGSLLVLLGGISLVWVNTHIFFVLGGGIIGYFWLKSIASENWQQVKGMSLAGLLVAAAWFINPLGLQGVLEPFNIFREYGYQVLENQPLWVLLRILPLPVYWYLLWSTVVLFGFAIWSTWQQRASRVAWVDLCFILLLGICTLFIYRLVSFYALLILPLLSQMTASFLQQYQKKLTTTLHSTIGTMVASLASFLLGVLLLGTGLLLPDLQMIGLGLLKDNNSAAAFWQNSQLEGPIFNNYDIGGYLIFHLYPSEQVFIDNRPEAYPVSFFTDEYIPAQEQEAAWQKLDETYQFNAIFFHRNDLTPWGQVFLVRMIQDEEWAPVFVDDWTIILLKKTTQNQAVIDRFRLPQELFQVSAPESY